jgi:hypothetical protein
MVNLGSTWYQLIDKNTSHIRFTQFTLSYLRLVHRVVQCRSQTWTPFVDLQGGTRTGMTILAEITFTFQLALYHMPMLLVLVVHMIGMFAGVVTWHDEWYAVMLQL